MADGATTTLPPGHHYGRILREARAAIAAIYAALGDKDRALAELEQAFRDHSVHMVSLWLNPWFRSLHGDPRFEALVARIRAGGAAEQPAASATGLK